MKKKKRKSHRRLVLIIAAATILSLAAYLLAWPFSSQDQTVRIYIDTDDNLDSVIGKVAVVEPCQTVGFRIVAMLRSVRGRVHSGSYEISPSISSWRLATNIYRGNQSPVSLIVPTTWTLEMALGRMSRHLMADSASLVNEFLSEERQRAYGVDSATVPTLLITNTYEVFWDITPHRLMERLARERDNWWNASRTAKAKALGMSREEVYTLASIVDAETANNGEKPTVAGLYLNRLRKGMLLQADPTVKFAMRNFGLRRIYGYMLSTPSPYNTYLHKGLPPGPIRVPQQSSIDAVLNAANHDYLYMCANSDFSGTHAFAATYSEHLANAARYVRALNARGIK